MAFVALAGLVSPARASTAGYGFITGILLAPNSGVILFNQGQYRSSVPACGAGLAQRWAIEGNTAGGQATVSGLLYAYANHKRVFIQGTGDCSVWGDTETVSYIQVEN